MRQMERIEREDASVEQATEKDSTKQVTPVAAPKQAAAAEEEDDLPELIDEGDGDGDGEMMEQVD